MKLTNRLGLPDAIVQAVQNDPYNKGDADISVTTLIGPPRVAALTEKYWHELEEDASDRIWSLMGQVVHGILERADTTGIVERRLSVDVLGWRVSGAMDRYCDGLLQDYKTSTVYKYKYNKAPQEVVEQLNCYAHILRENGHAVNRLEAIAILRDWSVNFASREPDYPQTQVLIVPIEIWPPEKAKEFIYNRVKLHQGARKALPECTPEERWRNPDKWAVMKKGRKTAIKLHEDKVSAELHAKEASDFYVEERPGEDKRCQLYCSVCAHCDQYKQALQKQGEPNGVS